jgi:tetratricopeptide (TPR) repeat protein
MIYLIDFRNGILNYLYSNKAELRFNLGIAHKDIGNKLKAINALKEAIRLKSNYAKAQYTICLTYSELSHRENAVKEFETLKKWIVELLRN